jgi:hypothetical protein
MGVHQGATRQDTNGDRLVQTVENAVRLPCESFETKRLRRFQLFSVHVTFVEVYAM